MKKIVIVVPYLNDGGAERVAARWSNILCNNYEVSVITFYPVTGEYVLDAKVERYNLYNDKNDYSRINFIKTVTALKKYLLLIQPDFLVPFLTETNIICSLASINTSIKCFQTIRNSPWHDPNRTILRVLRDVFIYKEKRVIVQNYEQSTYFKSRNCQKYVVCNPVSEDLIKNEKKHYSNIRKIVAVGRLARQKNYCCLIDAINILVKSNNEVVLDIYGNGPCREEIASYIKEKGLENHIRLRGRNNSIINDLPNYDMFIMTSLYEGFPNALLESMAVGLPVLAVECKTGIKELISNGNTGFLIRGYNPAEIANTILQNDKVDILEKVGSSARKSVLERFSLEECLKQLINCFESEG